ncbi:hypothetical protein ACFLYX_02350 [Chloroflexota bacterium]
MPIAIIGGSGKMGQVTTPLFWLRLFSYHRTNIGMSDFLHERLIEWQQL